LFPPFVFFEVLIWCLINKVSIKRVKFGSVPDKAKLIVFTYKGATELNYFKRRSFNKSSTIYWHLSHFMISSPKKAEVIQNHQEKSVLLCDSDMKENVFLSSLHIGKLPILLVPFVPASRFVNTNQDTRSEELLSVGSFHELDGLRDVRYFCDFYKTNSYHFIRSEIAKNQPDWVYNAAEFRSGLPGNDSFNMVDMLNSFKYVVCGDERWGAPAIGNFEAMACGSLPILVKENYLGLGLQEGLDFINYDGTIEGLYSSFKGVVKNHSAFNKGKVYRVSIRERLASIVDKSVVSIVRS